MNIKFDILPDGATCELQTYYHIDDAPFWYPAIWEDSKPYHYEDGEIGECIFGMYVEIQYMRNVTMPSQDYEGRGYNHVSI